METKTQSELPALAEMETASYCAGVRHNRYSGQLEIASKKAQKKMASNTNAI